MTRKLIILAAFLLLAVPAVAATSTDIDKGIYIGAGVGRSGIDASLNSVDFSGGDTGWKAIAGWRIAKYFSVEANWVDFGTADDTVSAENIEINGDGLDIAAIGYIPLGHVFELFGKYGFISWDTEISSDSGTLDANDDGSDTFWGAGFAFHFAESWEVRAEYEKFNIGDDTDTDMASLAMTYTF